MIVHEQRDAPLGVVLAQVSSRSWTNTPCLGAEAFSTPPYAMMVHRGRVDMELPRPTLRANSAQWELQERSDHGRVGHEITLMVAGPKCDDQTAPSGCLPHVGRPVAACAVTVCPAPIEWLVDIALYSSSCG